MTIFSTQTQVFPGVCSRIIASSFRTCLLHCLLSTFCWRRTSHGRGNYPRKQHLRQRKISWCHQSVSRTTTRLNSSLLPVMPSNYGLGAVLSHKTFYGSKQPIAYTSRTFNSAERHYLQLEKEGLSCIFGIKRFHDYIFGHHFKLVTDHKPLLGLLREDHAMPSHASSRIKRWALFLSNYEYSLVFRNTTAHANADELSWLPLPEEPASTVPVPELVLLACWFTRDSSRYWEVDTVWQKVI